MTAFLVRHQDAGCPGMIPAQASRPESAKAGCLTGGVWFKLWSAMAVGLVLLAGSLRAEFAYVLSQNINTLLAYRIGSNGALTPVPGSPFRTGVFPISMALDFWGRFAYVVNQGSQNISIYTIDANGALTFIGFGPGAGGRFGGPIAISP